MDSFSTWQRELDSNSSQQRHQIATASCPVCAKTASSSFPLVAPSPTPGADKAKKRSSCLGKCKRRCSRDPEPQILVLWWNKGAVSAFHGLSASSRAPLKQAVTQHRCWAALWTKAPWETTLWWAEEPREIKFCLVPKSDLFSRTLSQQNAHSVCFLLKKSPVTKTEMEEK